MTDAQDMAIEKIGHLIREHFEGGLFIVETDDEDATAESITRELWFHGGISRCIGLTEIVRQRLLARINNAAE